MSKAMDHVAGDLALLLGRVPIGLYLLLAGVGKIQGGVEQFVEQGFKPMQPAFLPDAVALPYAYAIPFLEVAFGAALIVGLLSRLSAGVIGLMILSFTIAQLAADFAEGLQRGPGPFNPNFVMIGLCVALVATGGGGWSLDRLWLGRRRRSVVA